MAGKLPGWISKGTASGMSDADEVKSLEEMIRKVQKYLET